MFIVLCMDISKAPPVPVVYCSYRSGIHLEVINPRHTCSKDYSTWSVSLSVCPSVSPSVCPVLLILSLRTMHSVVVMIQTESIVTFDNHICEQITCVHM